MTAPIGARYGEATSAVSVQLVAWDQKDCAARALNRV
jgi:hypothetical protein